MNAISVQENNFAVGYHTKSQYNLEKVVIYTVAVKIPSHIFVHCSIHVYHIARLIESQFP